MQFLRSRHVLVLVLTLLAIDLGVRLGAYEPVAEPASHSGVTIRLKRALREFGRDKVNVATLGDSRAVQGLDNQLVYFMARGRGLNHVRMSMPGSQLLTLKALSAWSIAELPELKGIVLAVGADVFARTGSGAYELAEVLPIRNRTSIREMLHHVPFRRSDIRTYASFYSIAGYREDIRNLLADPMGRLHALVERNSTAPLRFLAYNAQADTDICAVDTADPAACLNALRGLGSDTPAAARRGLKVLCNAALQGKKMAPAGQVEQEMIGEWTAFLKKLSRSVRVMVVLLPEHSIFMQYAYPPNASYVAHEVLTNLQRENVIELVDLRGLIMEEPDPECGFYMDARHLNRLGKERLTMALLPYLETFWAELGTGDGDGG